MGTAPAEERADLNPWPSSSHRLMGEELPVPGPEEGEAEGMRGPAAAHLHPTAAVHQPEPRPALNCK